VSDTHHSGYKRAYLNSYFRKSYIGKSARLNSAQMVEFNHCKQSSVLLYVLVWVFVDDVGWRWVDKTDE
jgi:hypothetical protein